MQSILWSWCVFFKTSKKSNSESCFSLLWGQNTGWDWERFLQSRKPLIRCRASSLVLKHEGQSGQMTSCECVGKVRIMLFCVKSQVKSAVPEPNESYSVIWDKALTCQGLWPRTPQSRPVTGLQSIGRRCFQMHTRGPTQVNTLSF